MLAHDVRLHGDGPRAYAQRARGRHLARIRHTTQRRETTLTARHTGVPLHRVAYALHYPLPRETRVDYHVKLT